MRVQKPLGHPLVPFLLLILSTVVPSVSAQETTPTLEEHEEAMNQIDYVLDEAEFHIDSRYWADLGADTDVLKARFTLVKAFWAARDADAAVGFVEQALAANVALSRASMESSRANAAQAVSDLRATCKGCHGEYREKTEDGFRIRSGG